MTAKYYAVQKGRNPGVYTDWDECKAQVSGFPGSKYQKFNSKEEAEAYLRESGITASAVEAKDEGGAANVSSSASANDGSNSQQTSSKKKNTGGYYAVKVGRDPGIYLSWSQCEAQVKGFPGAVYKKFADHNEAEEFVGID